MSAGPRIAGGFSRDELVTVQKGLIARLEKTADLEAARRGRSVVNGELRMLRAILATLESFPRSPPAQSDLDLGTGRVAT